MTTQTQLQSLPLAAQPRPDTLARISHEEVAKGLVSWHNWFI